MLGHSGGERLGMAKAEKATFIKAPQGLRQKAVNFHTGVDLMLTDEVRGRIEAVITESADVFSKDVLDKLREMRVQVKAAEDDPLSRIFILTTIAELAFDIKGMGGTFGYPLLSQLAKSLKDFIAELALPNEAQLEVISIHVDAMYVVLAQGVRGTSDKLQKDLLDNLSIAVSKVRDPV
jgi:HPt (histidine-containing phosphotransfer) domain-containing protein